MPFNKSWKLNIQTQITLVIVPLIFMFYFCYHFFDYSLFILNSGERDQRVNKPGFWFN